MLGLLEASCEVVWVRERRHFLHPADIAELETL